MKIALDLNDIREPSDVLGIPLLITMTDDFLPFEAA